jgi:hypothetical protein
MHLPFVNVRIWHISDEAIRSGWSAITSSVAAAIAEQIAQSARSRGISPPASDDAGEGAGATAQVVEAIGSAGARAETADCLAASLRVQAAHLDGEIRQFRRDVRRPNGRSAAAERRRRGPAAAASSCAVIARDDGEETGEAAILVRNNSYISAI